MTTTLTPEILVIGAGPGGSATATWLARLGHDVLMVDSTEFPRDKACGDGLTPLAVQNLDRLGVLDEILAAGAVQIDHTRITGPFGMSVTTSFSEHQPDYPYALVLPRFELDDILRRHAISAGAAFKGDARVTAIMREGNRITGVKVKTPHGDLQITPRQTVIAVGANMGLLKREGFITHEPRIIRAARAYYEHVPIEQPLYDFYFDLELLPGYGWMFPTGPNTANIGIGVLPVFWSSKQSTHKLLDAFIERRVKDGLMPPDAPNRNLKGYPLRIDYPSTRTAGRNWVIVGEAAGLVNPVTGEGIDLALESAYIAAETMHHVIEQGIDHHRAYQQQLWARFGAMFSGLRILRDILLTPFFTDYAIWLMNQHHFLTKTVMTIAQGIAPPQNVFHPLFILQFFMPVSPRMLVRAINGRDGSS